MDPSKDRTMNEDHRSMAAAENSGGDTSMDLQKKRSRRVSFAEMTSIHFFDRDEGDSETPPAKNARIDDVSVNELDFSLELDRADDIEGDDVEEMERRRPFLLSSAGSASSNDEDNFFGPVSSSFIRPEGLSDSAASDDNHDITMDSTAFSMHYRSLLRSESGGDLKTPSVGEFLSDEKTTRNTDVGSSMVFTLGNRMTPKSSTAISKLSTSHDSNDMSLVMENSNKYHYDRLSPGLDALLAESRKSLHFDCAPRNATALKPPRLVENGFSLLDQGDSIVDLNNRTTKVTGMVHHPDLPNGDASAARRKLDGTNTVVHDGCSPQRIPSSAFDNVSQNLLDFKSNGSPYQLMKSEYDSLLVASASPAKQKMLLGISSPSKHVQVELSLPEKPDSFTRVENVEQPDHDTSIQRSISKLESLERSAFSSTFSSKVDNTTIKSLEFSKPSPFEKFLYNHQEGNSLIVDGHKFDSVRHMGDENYLEESLGHTSGKSPNTSGARSLSAFSLTYGGPAVSPSNVTRLENSLNRSLFTPKHSGENALTEETESLLAEIANLKEGKTITTPLKLVSSPEKWFNEEASTSHQFGRSKTSIVSQFKRAIDFEKGQGSATNRNVADVNFSYKTSNTNAESMRMKGESHSPINTANHFKNMDDAKIANSREVDIESEENVGATDCFISPAKNKRSPLMHSKISDRGVRDSTSSPTFVDNFSGVEVNAISVGFKSPLPPDNLYESSFPKGLMKNSYIVQHVPEKSINRSSPRKQEKYSNQSPQRKDLHLEQVFKTLSPESNQQNSRLGSFSIQQRIETQHRTEMILMQRDPQNQRDGSSEIETQKYPNDGIKETTTNGQERKHWTNILSKFSVDTEHLFSLSDIELNMKTFDLLEDLLVRQQRSKFYETLYAEIAEKNTSVFPGLETIAETNLLLIQIVFEKAKLQLRHLKRKKLLRRSQVLASGIQESKLMKSSLLLHPPEISVADAMVHAIGDQPLPVRLVKGNEVGHEKLITMRQDLEAVDKKIQCLNRNFHESCKIKTEPSCCDTISIVSKHLTKKAHCRFIRLDMQMWVVQSIDSVNCRHNISLNYLGFIVQSIKVVGPTSSVSISYNVNDKNIIKNFPSFDACRAVTFVFNAETKFRYVGSKTLVREIQITSSLLGTLLDVFKEVQLAQMEFQNLIQFNFFSPSDDQLLLKLCFCNFNSGWKVILTLDMSCLKCGIYPSKIVPFQLESPSSVQNHGMSERMFSEVKGALNSVKTGYMRIFCLCRCVAQVIQANLNA